MGAADVTLGEPSGSLPIVLISSGGVTLAAPNFAAAEPRAGGVAAAPAVLVTVAAPAGATAAATATADPAARKMTW